ncbi:MAG: hypothetical protein NTY31_02610 [Candidatus Falkowbacteria bacterium]|nr:hypothetical protein [Candidatus Falkowbacteria bacterium]
MIDFENNSKNSYEVKQARQENQFYKKVEPVILNSRDYCLNDRARDLIAAFAAESGSNESEIVLSVLEHFNREQGALPGKLGEEYVRLVFSPEAIKNKMLADNLDFHETVAALAASAREKKFFLDKDLIDQAVKEAAKTLTVAVEA